MTQMCVKDVEVPLSKYSNYQLYFLNFFYLYVFLSIYFLDLKSKTTIRKNQKGRTVPNLILYFVLNFISIKCKILDLLIES